jgi:hypothetical protein
LRSEEARARAALERNRRLIEAGAVEEARQYRPAKSNPAYRPKQKKKRRGGKGKQRPIPAAKLPEAVERLRSHFHGEAPKR